MAEIFGTLSVNIDLQPQGSDFWSLTKSLERIRIGQISKFFENDFLGAFDYDGVWYTKWFDVDGNEDGVEEETIGKHFNDDRATMQKCYNPLDIEVMIKETFEDFKVNRL